MVHCFSGWQSLSRGKYACTRANNCALPCVATRQRQPHSLHNIDEDGRWRAKSFPGFSYAIRQCAMYKIAAFYHTSFKHCTSCFEFEMQVPDHFCDCL